MREYVRFSPRMAAQRTMRGFFMHVHSVLYMKINCQIYCHYHHQLGWTCEEFCVKFLTLSRMEIIRWACVYLNENRISFSEKEEKHALFNDLLKLAAFPTRFLNLYPKIILVVPILREVPTFDAVLLMT